MKHVWYCPFCKKKVEKHPKKIGNTIYLPVEVTHKHGDANYLLYELTFDEWMKINKHNGY